METKLGGVFILGATGEVGQEVLKELTSKGAFSRIVIITRRQLTEGVPNGVEQKIVDFDKIDEYADAFKDLEYGFCCLGTTRAKSGAAGFYKVDHDYVVNSAKVALANGCRHFSVVSSTGADDKSFFLYNQTKGQTEKDLQSLDFPRLSIYRPALLCDRKEVRVMETVGKIALTPFHWIFPTKVFMKTSTLAKVMVQEATKSSDEKVQLISNPDLCRIAKENNIPVA